MQDTILNIINSYGYLGVAFLIMIENVFPPIPSEIILIFSGFLTTYSDLTPENMVIASTIGSVVGAIIIYLIGYVINIEVIEKFLDTKFGKLLFLKKEDIERSRQWFLKYNGKAVFICRFIPLIRSLISFPAGMTKMKFLPFLIYTVVGTGIWNTVLIILGRIAGDKWEVVLEYSNLYNRIAFIIFLFVLAIAGLVYYKKYHKKK